MITIIYSTHKDVKYNSVFKKHLETTVGLKNTQILEYQNNNEFSLAQVYNRGISESIYDIVVCLHNDVKLEQGWGKKLMKDFEDNPDYGIIGKAGSCYFPESGVYWERAPLTMVGHVYHHPDGQNKWINKYSAKVPFLIPVVTIDGLIMAFNKTKIKHTFDETIGKYHFYDHPFCLANYLDGVKLGVTFSFDITHKSIGKPNDEFYESKEVFLQKYSEHLPLDLKPESVYFEKIIEKPLKNTGKVAIIIPTKGKLDLLFNCINSYIEQCNTDLFEVFIADTGSTDEEKQLTREFIKTNENTCKIHLVEYDYYNFAKINNDVVKNYVTDDFEFLLFSNNDIQVLNNVIFEMLSIYKNKNKIGTVGARLHYENNTIQHNGILCYLNKDKQFGVTHAALHSYYTYTPYTKNVIGSTAALLMIKKNLFEKQNGYNENYTECFEDVELNLRCILMGYENYLSGKSVAYHYESQTRNESEEKNKKTIFDYQNFLNPFVMNNFDKFKHLFFNTGDF
jgi:GT2 family glycosyltransferase